MLVILNTHLIHFFFFAHQYQSLWFLKSLAIFKGRGVNSTGNAMPFPSHPLFLTSGNVIYLLPGLDQISFPTCRNRINSSSFHTSKLFVSNIFPALSAPPFRQAASLFAVKEYPCVLITWQTQMDGRSKLVGRDVGRELTLFLMLFNHWVVSDSFATPWAVHGIFQARILKWVAIFHSRGSSWSRNQTWGSYHVSCVIGGFFTTEPPAKLLIYSYYKLNIFS